MLVLSDADGLRIDLHELRERILQAARHTCCAPLPDVKMRELLGRKCTRAVNGRAGLVHDDVLHRAFALPDDLRDDLFRLARCRTVAEADEIDVVLLDKTFDDGLCFRDLLLRLGRENNRRIENFSGRIHDGDLAAGPERGIPAEHGLARDWRRKEELPQVLAENDDGTVLRCVRKARAELVFNGRRDEAFVSVPDRGPDRGCRDGIGRGSFFQHLLLKICEDLFFRRVYFHGKEAFLFAAVYREHAVPRDLRKCLLIGKIHFVDAAAALELCIDHGRLPAAGLSGRRGIFSGCRFTARHGLRRLLLRGDKRAVLPCLIPDRRAEIRAVGDLLGDDVLRALERLLRCSYPELIEGVRAGWRHERRRHRKERFAGRCILRKDPVRERPKAFLRGDAATRPAFLLVRTVKILHRHERFGVLNLFSKLRRKLPLLLNGAQDRLLPLFEVPERRKLPGKRSELLVIQGAGRLLAVARDERDRIAFVEELHGRLDLPFLYAECLCDLSDDIHGSNASFFFSLRKIRLRHVSRSTPAMAAAGHNFANFRLLSRPRRLRYAPKRIPPSPRYTARNPRHRNARWKQSRRSGPAQGASGSP